MLYLESQFSSQVRTVSIFVKIAAQQVESKSTRKDTSRKALPKLGYNAMHLQLLLDAN